LHQSAGFGHWQELFAYFTLCGLTGASDSLRVLFKFQLELKEHGV
jgi:hypothetical protein